MTLLTNSLRPSTVGTSIKAAGPAYSAYKLRGSCSKCGDRSHQTVNSGHPIFKMVCPDCRVYLTELKQRKQLKQLDENSLLSESKTP